MFQFFLRNPFVKKWDVSSNIIFFRQRYALSYLHDLGFIPKIVNGERGFKVMLGGGLGSQPAHELLSEFIQTKLQLQKVLRIFEKELLKSV
jgi:sulfite reductase (ferredoxin)